MAETLARDASTTARERAAALVLAQRPSEAIAVLKDAAGRSTTDWQSRKELAHLLLRLSDHSGARQAYFAAFHAILRLSDPEERAEASNNLLAAMTADITLFSQAGHTTAAEHIADLATQLFPQSFDATAAHATVLERQKEWRRLGNTARRLASLKHDDPKLLRWVAGTLARIGAWREAVLLIRTAWRARPGLATVTNLQNQPDLIIAALQAQRRHGRERAVDIGVLVAIVGAVASDVLYRTTGWIWTAGLWMSGAAVLLGAELWIRLRLWRACHVPGETLIMPPIDWDRNVHIQVSNTCPVEFDHVGGFRYRAHQEVVTGTLENGRALSATSVVMTADGFMKPKEPPSAEGPHIAVLGDSFVACLNSQTGLHWPHFMGAAVERQTGKAVRVQNCGREFYGLLQMVDLAADLVRRSPPDLIIFAYISRAVRRKRSWAHRAFVGGQERFLRSPTAAVRPHVPTSYDAGGIDSRVTMEWLEARAGEPKWDPLFEDIWRRFLLYRQRGDFRCFDFFDFGRSALLNQLFYGDAFGYPDRISPRQRQFLEGPQVFETDAAFLANIATLRQANVPIALVHVPVIKEIEKRSIFSGGSLEISIMDGFERALGTTTIPLLPWILRQEFDIKRFCLSDRDDHPSPLGERVYGEAVASALLDRGILTDLFKRASS